MVDPDSQLCQNTLHIYCDGNLKYSVMLTLVDINNNTNLFHQIQLLEQGIVRMFIFLILLDPR